MKQSENTFFVSKDMWRHLFDIRIAEAAITPSGSGQSFILFFFLFFYLFLVVFFFFNGGKGLHRSFYTRVPFLELLLVEKN
jgi:hypothetical protein